MPILQEANQTKAVRHLSFLFLLNNQGGYLMDDEMFKYYEYQLAELDRSRRRGKITEEEYLNETRILRIEVKFS